MSMVSKEIKKEISKYLKNGPVRIKLVQSAILGSGYSKEEFESAFIELINTKIIERNEQDVWRRQK